MRVSFADTAILGIVANEARAIKQARIAIRILGQATSMCSEHAKLERINAQSYKLELLERKPPKTPDGIERVSTLATYVIKVSGSQYILHKQAEEKISPIPPQELETLRELLDELIATFS